MKSRIPRYAGVVAAMIALVLITGLLAVFGTVDVIFMKNGLYEEWSRGWSSGERNCI